MSVTTHRVTGPNVANNATLNPHNNNNSTHDVHMHAANGTASSKLQQPQQAAAAAQPTYKMSDVTSMTNGLNNVNLSSSNFVHNSNHQHAPAHAHAQQPNGTPSQPSTRPSSSQQQPPAPQQQQQQRSQQSSAQPPQAAQANATSFAAPQNFAQPQPTQQQQQQQQQQYALYQQQLAHQQNQLAQAHAQAHAHAVAYQQQQLHQPQPTALPQTQPYALPPIPPHPSQLPKGNADPHAAANHGTATNGNGNGNSNGTVASTSTAVVAAAAASGTEEEKNSNGTGTGVTPARSKYKTFILADAVFEVEQRYDIKEIVGHGAYGIVCSARDLKSNQLVAVKKIENIFEHRSLAKRTLRELKLVRYFYHENILGLERVMRPHNPNFNNVYMVTELMETDLACVIRSPQELTDEHCQFFIYQVLRGLKYIHSANVVHRDLKPRNLLVNSNCDLKICDFGLARLDDPENADRCVMSNYVATRWYRAPEVILSRKRYTKAVDMWSVGCILAELLGRKPLFPGRDSFHQITLIVSILGTPATATLKGKKSRDYVAALPKKPKISFAKIFPKSSPLACDLLDKLLQFEPENRYTVEQALRHPYLEELHCEEDEPVCEHFDPQEFYFEYLRTTKEDLRVLIHQEIVNNYKEDDYEPKEPTTDSFASQVVLKALPKGKRRRRKSF